MWKYVGRFLRWFIPKRSVSSMTDQAVTERYTEAGGEFGGAVSYLYMGECIGFEELFNVWALWELEYAKRGYRTLSIDDFVGYGGYGKDISPQLSVRRTAGEPFILHAEMYRQRYLGKIAPIVDMAALLKPGAQPQCGLYELPSTKDVQQEG